ncbi:MAG: chitin synthase-domain-containing protein [Benjaminiella poitrasii]|nr:MAG: chitin synthase-domain-containing protein [Benjaminiella poitrasii]
MGKLKKSQINSNINDLSTLQNPTNETISACLRSRYDEFKIYTNIGSRHLVAINPLKELAINDDQTSLEYVAAYKDASSNSSLTHVSLLDPHLFDLVNRVYFHMRRTGSDQNIILRGESGSGKSEIRKLTIRHLVRLSSHKKESKVQTQITASQKILGAFGECSSNNRLSASRFGYYGEIQFNERGRMVGAKTLHYCLEKSRVTGHSATDSNFNVFYYLLAGVTPEEKTALQITNSDPSFFQYLSKYKRRSISSTSTTTATTPAGEDEENDASRFEQLKANLKLCGFRKDHVARIVQLVATILHLGNLVFADPVGTGTQEAAFVKNIELLDVVADFLGLDPHALENVLTFKTTMIRKDFTTLILNAEQASVQRDNLCQTLYSLLFSWIVERINNKTCTNDFNSFIGVLDFPGLQQSDNTKAGFEQLCVNLGNEYIQHYLDQTMFKTETDLLRMEGIQAPELTLDESCLDLLSRPTKGICNLVNTMTDVSKRNYSDDNIMDSIIKYNSSHPAFSIKSTDTNSRSFVIHHYSGSSSVQYSTRSFIEQNNSQISVDFVSLFKGGMDVQPSWNAFIVDLFANVKVENHPKHNSAIIGAQQSAKPTRQPSQRRSKRRNGGNDSTAEKKDISYGSVVTTTVSTILQQIQSAMDELIQSFEEAKLWSVFCILPRQFHTGTSTKTMFDTQYVTHQLDQMKIATISSLPTMQYVESYLHQDFLIRYAHLFNGLDTTRLVRSQCEDISSIMNWTTTSIRITKNKVFLSASVWKELENQLRYYEKIEQRQAKEDATDKTNDTGAEMNRPPFAATAAAVGLPLPTQQFAHQDDRASYYSEEESGQYAENDGSYYGTESYVYSAGSDQKNEFGFASPPRKPIVENLDANEEDETKMTGARKRWLFFVYFATWWIPSKFLIWCGRMKRKDVRIAWREKVTLCMIIFLMCAFVIWFLVFFGEVVCPKQHIFSISELQNHGLDAEKAYVAIRGEVFDLTNFAPRHYPANLVPTSSVMQYAGQDVTGLFPVQVSALCEGVDGTPISPYVSVDYQVNLTDTNGEYHDFRYSSDSYNANWYYDQMTLLRKNYKVGHMGYESKAVSDQAKSATLINGINTLRTWAVIDQYIYDLTAYTMGGRYLRGPPGEAIPTGINTDFLSQEVVSLFQQKAGSDITNDFHKLPLSAAARERQLVCLRNLFFVGFVDTRNSPKCQFSTYLLLIVTLLLASVIVFKFVAAIRIGGKRAPEEHDKFVICQVTCYTEDEESLRKTIDSLSTLQYDDKRKLLFVICDGMIVGSGNDLPTPRIVLNILGVDPHVDPEALSFVSVGEGLKQHNMGKIYSGLYEVAGHVVPYIVVVKCGHPRERQKPGNRGKRDSQLVLMQFLNRVHYDGPMNPLQLEIYHQMKNIIGVSPDFYEFVLMVDADTEVMRDGLNYLVSSAVHDSKVIGICGETTLQNEKDTWVTMIQVYEYFISHHLIKSFESLFSTVSCLPGCFTMYRIRTLDGKRALFVSNEIISDYSVNVVDTLHKKNLLHLGEDRYLTTLLLKHFPNFKTKFNPDAHCKTNAPDLWSVLVSQRRRWINSTIHNLGELVFLPRLCGFCCFSMRFIVMLDLISTLVMPALLGYLGYLIYTLATLDGTIPIVSIATIAGTYGLQALLFIIKGRWEFVMWMIVSLFALPVFSFYIPVYSYWHFDDFSWGNTRVVVGDKGQKVAVAADEGTFDPKSIPTMKWSEYERALLSEDHWSDNMSQGSSSVYSRRSGSRMMNAMTPGSVYHNPITAVMGSPDSMSMHSSGMMQPYPPKGNTMMTDAFDRPSSVMMPSSTSMPRLSYANSAAMMPNLPSSRSMASFAPAQSYQNMPSSQYILMQSPVSTGSSHSLMMDGFTMGNSTGPKNEEILAEVQKILRSADLNKITKKQVREDLQNIFGVSMASRKDYINACIESILQQNSHI